MDTLADLRATKRRVYPARMVPEKNAPRRFYLKPDGDILALPGDKDMMTLYVNKGYALLTPAQEMEWTGLEPGEAIHKQELTGRPYWNFVTPDSECAKQQARDRDRALKVTQIRTWNKLNPTLRIDIDLNKLSIADMDQVLDAIRAQGGRVVDVITAESVGISVPDAGDEIDLTGIEVGGGEQLRAKLDRRTPNHPARS